MIIIQLVPVFFNELIPVLFDLGLLGIFIAYLLPSVFVFEEITVTALVMAKIPPISIALFATLGGFFGNSLWFFLGRYSYRKLKNMEQIKIKKEISHYKKLLFLVTGFPGGELIAIYGGAKHYHYGTIAPFMAASNLIRVSIGIIIVSGLMTNMPDFLKQIFF